MRSTKKCWQETQQTDTFESPWCWVLGFMMNKAVKDAHYYNTLRLHLSQKFKLGEAGPQPCQDVSLGALLLPTLHQKAGTGPHCHHGQVHITHMARAAINRGPKQAGEAVLLAAVLLGGKFI